MTFLKIPVGARGEAMGGAYVAIANDEFAAFWNPAGIAQLENRWTGKYVMDPQRPPEGVKAPPSEMSLLSRGNRAVGTIHNRWLVEVAYNAVAYTQPLPTGVLGISLASLSTADMEITTEYHPDGTGEYFNYSDFLVGVTYALEMTENFSWGASLKYARENLADTYMNNFVIDLGTYYWVGARDLRFGFAIVNFGPNGKPEGGYDEVIDTGETIRHDYKAFAPPTEFRLGAAMTVFAAGQHKFLGAVQLNHPVDNSENMKLGMEYSFMGVLFCRGGYKMFTDEDRWTAGLGVRVPWKGIAVSADYSYTDFDILKNAQRFSVGITF